ncbi:MAG: RNA pyrophosphohydrolase [Spirochaetia bacterium]|nr:RNA pyrophosphohydrolase [Spirochaetia bacterium]
MVKPYRDNVGIVVFNSRGMVLVGERVQYPGIFQFPQGGMDAGETPLQAAVRELYEETSLEMSGAPAGELPDWLLYDFPQDIPAHLKKYAGQRQKWFFFFWDGDTADLKLDLHEREFTSVKWSDLDEIADSIVSFKKPVYNVVRSEGKRIIQEHLEKFR